MENYILVTPVRNEIDNIEKLILSILNQTRMPVYWLIMDDNSIDGSLDVIKEFSNKYEFIDFIELEKANRDLGWRYHRIMSSGFSIAIENCRHKNISWDYIGVLDSDIFYKQNNYYELLINEFSKDEKNGILSGEVYSLVGSIFIKDFNPSNFPRGANRLISKKCLIDIGNYPVEQCADSTMRIRAEHKGYICKSIPELIAYQSRETTNSRLSFKDSMNIAKMKYYLGYSFFYFIGKFFLFVFKFQFGRALGFISGYFQSLIKRVEKNKDPLIRNYYSKKFKIFK